MADATMNTGTIIERDLKTKFGGAQAGPSELLAHAAKASGRGVFSVWRESRKWAKGPAKIRLDEYVQYGLFDPARHIEEERGAFISAWMHKPVVNECIDQSWFAVTEDKWLSSVFLKADGVPVPETLAVIDRTQRCFPGVEKISSPEALREFLTGGADFPLFGKFNTGRWSVGAFIITGADESSIHLHGGDSYSYGRFVEEFVGKDAFLLQRFVENHSFLKQYSDTTATVRMVNMWTDEGLWTPYAILKLPSPQNHVDNFWRDGNLVCNLDPETGEILTVVGRNGLELVNHEKHPESGKEILGQMLPHWERLREVNAQVARLHHPIRYQSQDIAITEDGPVVIEINTGGAFELYQIASGRGFMQPKVREFFRSCGSTKV